LAAILTLAFAIFRSRRDFRQTHIQARAGLLQGLQSILWLSAIALAAAWGAVTRESDLIFDWPGLLLLAASACALVATFLTVACAALLPLVLRSGRRVDSWSALRRAGFTATVVVSLVLSLLLGLWGGLSPWAG